MQGSDVLAPLPRPPRERFGEPLKFVPILFVCFTITFLWSIYVFKHCLPLLQLHVRPALVDVGTRWRAEVELVIFHIIVFQLLFCYVRSILVHPGRIPQDPQWDHPGPEAADRGHRLVRDALAKGQGRAGGPSVLLTLRETKKTGDRRHCKWCSKYKPDRCHHCRVCKTCILRMDHHCPWIYNCVGLSNYKFFFLTLLYAAMACHFMVWTMSETLKRCVETDTPFITLFLVLFGETLAFLLGVLVSSFFGFHVWLMLKAMTTIEFCEKSFSKEGERLTYDAWTYDQGIFRNVSAVLGSNVLLWFLPVAAEPLP